MTLAWGVWFLELLIWMGSGAFGLIYTLQNHHAAKVSWKTILTQPRAGPTTEIAQANLKQERYAIRYFAIVFVVAVASVIANGTSAPPEIGVRQILTSGFLIYMNYIVVRKAQLRRKVRRIVERYYNPPRRRWTDSQEPPEIPPPMESQ